jgi:predicted DNA-binding transcriptional regulator YafY
MGLSARGEKKHELPGMWFSESELHALLASHKLLSGIDQGGLVARHTQPVLDRIHQLLGIDDGSEHPLLSRIKVMASTERTVPCRHLEVAATALVQRQRLHISYWSRPSGAKTERELSPQRLLHYRSTWYLDAWCHRAGALRRFAMDAIESMNLLNEKAKDLSVKTVETKLDRGYGICSGDTLHQAVLLFSDEAAQWVRHERWHPGQAGRLHTNGTYELKLPYTDSTELEMDILRHGEHVTVLGDDDLHERIKLRIEGMRMLYR